MVAHFVIGLHTLPELALQVAATGNVGTQDVGSSISMDGTSSSISFEQNVDSEISGSRLDSVDNETGNILPFFAEFISLDLGFSFRNRS